MLNLRSQFDFSNSLYPQIIDNGRPRSSTQDLSRQLSLRRVCIRGDTAGDLYGFEVQLQRVLQKGGFLGFSEAQ